MKSERRDQLPREPHPSRRTALAFISGMGLGGAIMYVFMNSARPTVTARVGKPKVEQAGDDWRDEVGYSGVFPATGPFPAGEAKVIPAGHLGGGDYEDHGTSTFTTNPGTASVAESGGPAGAVSGAGVLSWLQEGEIPRERWLTFFNQLDKQIRNERVTVELQENGETRVAQRDMPIDGFGADVRARELIINVGVGSTKDDLVIHTISAQRVRVRNEGDGRVLEIEGPGGRVVLVRFRSGDVVPQRVA